MKELSIEQKAKRYDEILVRAEGANLPYYKEDIMSKVKEFVDYLIPELKEKESENADEKVRKALIKLVTNHASMDLFIEYDIHLYEAIDWLEKQGKQEPWKPSDDQMAALNDINLTGNISYPRQGQELINLYNDLKKLKGGEV